MWLLEVLSALRAHAMDVTVPAEVVSVMHCEMVHSHRPPLQRQ